MNDLEEKLKDLKNNLEIKREEHSLSHSRFKELSNELSIFENLNFKELFVGKFFRQEEMSRVVYFYCKNMLEENPEDYGLNNNFFGICDTFSIPKVERQSCQSTFSKDIRISKKSLENEITRKEYEQAIEVFHDNFKKFISSSRIVITEKNNK